MTCIGEEGIAFGFWEGENERRRFEDVVVYDIKKALEEAGRCCVDWFKTVTGVWRL